MDEQNDVVSTSSLFQGKQLVTDRIGDIVRAVLNAWSAYQIAIRQQTAGHETAEKDAWFRDCLTQYLMKNKSLLPWDLSEWLEELLSQEFDLIVEDDTLELTAALILRLVSLVFDKSSCGGDAAKAQAQLEENLVRLHSLASNSQSVQFVDQSNSDVSSESDEDVDE